MHPRSMGRSICHRAKRFYAKQIFQRAILRLIHLKDDEASTQKHHVSGLSRERRGLIPEMSLKDRFAEPWRSTWTILGVDTRGKVTVLPSWRSSVFDIRTFLRIRFSQRWRAAPFGR